MPRKEHLTTPIIIGRFLYTEQAPVPLDTPTWFGWLAHHSTFYFDSPLGTFTARLEPRAAGLPRRILPQTTSSLTSYASMVQAFVATGKQSGTELWHDLQGQGYRGSLSSVCRALKHLQAGDQRRVRRSSVGSGSQRPAQEVGSSKPRPLSARQAKWLLVRQPEQVQPEEVALRERLLSGMVVHGYMRPVIDSQ